MFVCRSSLISHLGWLNVPRGCQDLPKARPWKRLFQYLPGSHRPQNEVQFIKIYPYISRKLAHFSFSFQVLPPGRWWFCGVDDPHLRQASEYVFIQNTVALKANV